MSTTLSPWLAPARAEWDAAVDKWLAAVAKQHNLGTIRACTTLKERPWSLVRRIDFDGGTYYFKACSAGGQVEPTLLLFLKNHAAQNMPQVLAAELDRGWLLLADSGLTLRDTVAIAEQLKILADVLATYAKLQIASLQWVDPLLDLGLPDRRLDQLPTLLNSLMAGRSVGVGTSHEEVEALRAAARKRLPRFEKTCAELAKSPYSTALDHGDLHTRNILIKEENVTLIDWGDACITHPFCSLLVTFEWLQNEIPQPEWPVHLATLRDAYLAPWATHYPLDMLHRDFERAQWVAHVGRALDFDHMFAGADEETLDQWRPMIFDRLLRWVDCCPPHNNL